GEVAALKLLVSLQMYAMWRGGITDFALGLLLSGAGESQDNIAQEIIWPNLRIFQLWETCIENPNSGQLVGCMHTRRAAYARHHQQAGHTLSSIEPLKVI